MTTEISDLQQHHQQHFTCLLTTCHLLSSSFLCIFNIPTSNLFSKLESQKLLAMIARKECDLCGMLHREESLQPGHITTSLIKLEDTDRTDRQHIYCENILQYFGSEDFYWYNCLQSDVVCVQYLGTVTRSQTEKDWFNIYLAENWKNGAIVSISLALHKPSHKLRTKMSVKDVNCCSNFIIPSSVRF